ncbi:MAG: arginine--tRNA ligase [Clostridia bacterium]|nr:arginine--tRNA ligase [Clostridia bacterium]
MSIKESIASAIANILDKDVAEIYQILDKSPNLEMGDYSLPCFKLAKELKMAPLQIANNIKDKLILPEIDKIEVVSGYLNIFIKKEIYVKSVLEEIANKREKYGSTGEGKGKTALVEHTSINPNASPHIGRARNALIGDSVVKILNFNDYKVETHYFVNDIGKQISMLLVGSKNKENVKFDELLQLYVDINKRVEEDKDLEQEVFDNLYKLENGDKETIQKFRNIVETCIEGQKEIFGKLGIHYDYFDYESDFIINGKVDEVLEKLKDTGKLFEAEDGRLAINQEEYHLPMKSPVLVVTRADKTSLYPLRDIAYSIYKAERNTDKNVIILGEDQKLYFQQISAALDLLGYKTAQVIHYSFVLLPSGKMSTRNGTVVLLEDFMKEILEKTKQELAKRNEGNIDEEKAKKIAYGAVKYTILKGSCEKNVTFDLEKALSFDGDTSLYIQYNYARINSILTKANYEGMVKLGKFELLNEDAEIQIIQKLEEFKSIIAKVTEKLTPNLIANYVYDLTKLFSSYYHDYSILNAETEELKNMRLQLIYSIGEVIEISLNLLGIETVDEI